MENTYAPVTQSLDTVLDRVPSRLFDWLMYVFIFITVFLPSGSIYGLNVKSPLYLALLPLATIRIFRQGLATRERLALLLSVPLILSAWVVLGLVYGFPLASALRQYMDVALVLLLGWLVMVFCGDDDARRMLFLRVVLSAEIATSLFKVGLIGYAVLRGIPTVELVAALSKVFGVNLMTMDLGAMFGRVQFVSDAVIPVCIFIVLRHRDQLRIGNLRAALFVLLLVVSVLFSFSRYLWAFTAIAFLAGLLTGRRDRFQLLLTCLLGACVFASLPAVISLYQLRFSADVAGSSDLIRTEQTSALKAFFKDAPLLGHGLGSYTNQVVREQETEGGVRYSYEAQLLALAGQIGVAGLTFLFVLGAYYYSDLWWRPRSSLKDRVAVAGLLGFWICAGLYNPLLLHPVAGVNYAVFAALASVAHKAGSSDLSNSPVGV